MRARSLLLLGFIFSIRIYSQIINTVVGTGIAGYNGDNILATTADITTVGGMVFDQAGNLYLSDHNNHRIRKVDSNGLITTIAGNGVMGFAGDNGPAINASLNYPAGLSFDAAGNLYIADFYNERIRKVNMTTGVITTVAGNGVWGNSGDNGPATLAQVGTPDYLAFDSQGNLYITQGNHHCIRKIDVSGTITTIAGTGTSGYNGDNIPAVSAQVDFPVGITIDAQDRIYFSELGGARVRKIDQSGMISTLAGTGISGYNGNGITATTAQVQNLRGLTLDAQGNLVIVSNNRIRKIDSQGNLTTIAGSGNVGYNGDLIPALTADFTHPTAICYSVAGDLYVADNDNYRVRTVFLVDGVKDQFDSHAGINVFPNPTSGNFTISFPADAKKIKITNAVGQVICEYNVTTETVMNSKLFESGIYFVSVSFDKHIITKKMVVTP
ncbi:MAG: T9SS type A sorting domain-containing protein [Bacteroidota bacterium]